MATIRTNCGDITLELDGAKAPQTVASFVQLAQKAYWKDSPCHRLTTAGLHVLQCGDPTGTGSGGPGYGYGIENAPVDGNYPAGTLAMARGQLPDTNGGQFFFVYDTTVLPTDGGGYSIFGRVTSGMDILARIAKAGVESTSANPYDGPPAQPISILSVAVTEKKA
ncbi:peptidylprolyl isomerase [Luteipulveratus sp. YIM 133132]|uniref:peptidylprolyl isomerase n=1 Tax=Luteipulveratus flavus TaxID=3031728 RepID=UPI0023AFEBF3|nr:peptidylprolyl isomerase [Luteipulveratus sp. YIM 133132]MDE9367335.1 peptidylprolyl isomerase [Luteipulveratus sp. YIM 133132]